jgi:hypothetical protein
MVELYEENISEWFFKQRDNVTLTEFLCENIILSNDDKCKFNINEFSAQIFKFFVIYESMPH